MGRRPGGGRSARSRRELWARKQHARLRAPCTDSERAAGRNEAPELESTRHGCRPLRPGEIVSNWDIIRDSCLIAFDIRTASAQSQAAHVLACAVRRAISRHTAVLEPYGTVQAGVAAAAPDLRVAVMTHLPMDVTRRVLAGCGFDCSSTELLPLGREQTCVRLLPPVDRATGTCSRWSQHLVVDSLADALALQGQLLDADRCGANVRLARVHLCDWAGAPPVMRASAAHAGVHVMSDCDLVALLRAEHDRRTMDHVAWEHQQRPAPPGSRPH